MKKGAARKAHDEKCVELKAIASKLLLFNFNNN